jgi:hypothetical protein
MAPAGGPAIFDQARLDWLRTETPRAESRKHWLTAPPDPGIHLVHLKAKYSPYIIVDPKLTMIASFSSLFGPTGGMFP